MIIALTRYHRSGVRQVAFEALIINFGELLLVTEAIIMEIEPSQN